MMAAVLCAVTKSLAQLWQTAAPAVAAFGTGDDPGGKGNLEALGKAFGAVSKSFSTEGRGSPAVLLIVFGAAVATLSIFAVWRWQQQIVREPSSAALLKMACDQLRLSSAQRQFLWLLGKTGGLEPAIALASPQLLTGMVHQAEQAGLELSPARTLQIGQILDIVSAASTEPK